jgi:hypothetical protein
MATLSRHSPLSYSCSLLTRQLAFPSFPLDAAQSPLLQMTRSTMPAAAAIVGALLLLYRDTTGANVAPRADAATRRLAAYPANGFVHGCSAPALWCDVRTKAMCPPPVATAVREPMRRSAQTAVGNEASEMLPSLKRTCFAVPWYKWTVGTTDRLRPEPVGRSRRHHRRVHHRRVRRKAEDDDADPDWVRMAVGAAVGLLAAIDPFSTWAWVTVATGVGMLAADWHFWWPVCVALSFNYWAAAAWIAWTVSWDVGVALVAVAVGLRGSAWLFPVSFFPGFFFRSRFR